MADRRDFSSALKRAITCKNVNMERIKLLIKKSNKLYSEVLNDAVKSTECNLEVIKLLLNKGAELDPWILCDALRSKGCTSEIIKLLLERGAKLYRSILADAVVFKRCNFELIKLLINKGAYIHPMILSSAIKSKKCDLNTLKLLLDCGVLATSESLWCAINSKKCSFEFVKLLIERSEKRVHQSFELDLISETISLKRCDKMDIVQLLLEYGLNFYNADLGEVIQECGGNIKFIKYVLENIIIIDEYTFSWYKIDSSNVNASKILLQYYLVQHSENSLSELNKTLSHENFFKNFKFADKTSYKEISDFFSLLLKEFIKMTKDKIDYDLTLFSYVSNKYSSACVKHKTKCSYANAILSRVYSKQYVYSRDVLCSSLSKYDVAHNLFDLDIFVIKDENFYGDKVSLNYDSIIYLVSYLSRDDIINLILAFGK